MTDMANQLTEPWVAQAVIDENGDWIVGYVEKDKPGYWPTTYRYNADEGGHKVASATADSINNTKGVTREEAWDIVASSFRASQEGLK